MTNCEERGVKNHIEVRVKEYKGKLIEVEADDLFVVMIQDKYTPKRVIIRARNFKFIGIEGSGRVGKINHLIRVPPEMAPKVRRVEGMEVLGSLLFV